MVLIISIQRSLIQLIVTNIVIPVAYTADEVEYKWLEGASPVGYEGELQLSQVIWASVECQKSPGAITLFQFDLQKTFFRQLNFTRSESGDILWHWKKSPWPTMQCPINIIVSWNLLGVASGVPPTKTHWIFSHPGTMYIHVIKQQRCMWLFVVVVRCMFPFFSRCMFHAL